MNAAMTQMPRTKIIVSAIALSVVAMFGLGFGATTAWAASPAGNASPNAYLRVLSEPASAEDQLPEEREGVPYGEGMGLRHDTSRYLGSDGNAQYWVVVHEQGRICLVNVLTATGDSSMVCVTRDRFAREGVSGAVTSFGVADEEKGYAEAYLVPDSLRFVAVPEGLNAVSDSLVAGDSRSQTAGDSRNQKGTLRAATKDGNAQLQMQLIHPDRAH